MERRNLGIDALRFMCMGGVVMIHILNRGGGS